MAHTPRVKMASKWHDGFSHKIVNIVTKHGNFENLA